VWSLPGKVWSVIALGDACPRLWRAYVVVSEHSSSIAALAEPIFDIAHAKEMLGESSHWRDVEAGHWSSAAGSFGVELMELAFLLCPCRDILGALSRQRDVRSRLWRALVVSDHFISIVALAEPAFLRCICRARFGASSRRVTLAHACGGAFGRQRPYHFNCWARGASLLALSLSEKRWSIWSVCSTPGNIADLPPRPDDTGVLDAIIIKLGAIRVPFVFPRLFKWASGASSTTCTPAAPR
jgi:hypothetical protein